MAASILQSRFVREALKLTPRYVFDHEYNALLASVNARLGSSGQRLPRTFDRDDKVVVHWYTKDSPTAGLDYRKLNTLMRTGVHSDSSRLYVIAAYLFEALEKLPRREAPSYRVVAHYSGVPNYVVGSVITELDFLSSSRNPRIPFPGEYYCTVVGRSGRDIGGISVFGIEDEILFPPHLKFRILWVENLSDGSTHVVMKEEA